MTTTAAVVARVIADAGIERVFGLPGGEVLVCPETAARDGVTACRDPLAQMRDRARPEGDVHERVLLEDALALSLGVAPSDRHDDVWPVALQRSGVPEVRRQPGIRLLADRARVEHDDVGTVLRGRLAEPKRLEHPLDPLGIVSVHLAAERGDVVAPHG